jgi:inorganic pyrophosphatase
MRRALVLASVVLLVLVATERRAGEPGRHLPAGDGPAFWTPVVEHRQPFQNCVFVTSEDPADGFAFTPVVEGVRFDIDADGTPDSVSWTVAGSRVAFLALDQDGDGAITSARELVGERTTPGARGAPGALLALAADASNDAGARRASIDPDDALFLRLLLWTDANHDGVSQPPELRHARDAFANIGLGFSAAHREDRHGNQIRYRGFAHVRTNDGPVVTAEDEAARRRPMYEVCLAGQPAQPPAELPVAAVAKLAESLAAARGHGSHVWRDTAPFNADGTLAGYVEIPRGERRKWEFDMGGNARIVDRVMPADPGGYPVNYGFVPQTSSYDVDPFDVLVLGPPLDGGRLVSGIVVGLMHMEDEKGLDSKVVISPVDGDGRALHALTDEERQRIGGYFSRYKLHEPGKFSTVPGWDGPEAGRAFVRMTHAFFRECLAARGSACRVTPR